MSDTQTDNTPTEEPVTSPHSDTLEFEFRERLLDLGSKEIKEKQSTTFLRIGLWIAGCIAGFGALYSIVFGTASGWPGIILLFGVAIVAFLLVLAFSYGESAGRLLSGQITAKRQATPELNALDALSDPVLIADPKGRPFWANAAYLALEGQETHGGVPAPERIWSTGDDGAIFRLTRAGLQDQSHTEILPPIVQESGDTVVYAGRVSPVAKGGTLWQFTEAHLDPQSEDPVLPDWADKAPIAMFMADGEGRVLSSNATLRDWLGVDADKPLKISDFLMGDMVKSFIASRSTDGVVRLDARMLAREQIESPVVLAVEWDQARPPRARCVVYGLSVTGAPPGIAQSMSSSRNKAGTTFDDTFSTAPFGVIRLDQSDPSSGMVEDSNPAMMQFSGGAAIPGTRFSDLFDWTDGPDMDEVFDVALSGRGEPVEARLQSGDKIREVHLFFSPAQGKKRIAYVVDISSWKDLERQLAHAAKMQAVGQLAGGVAHDFNNMLTAIRLNTDELLGRHPIGDPSYPELQQINATVARAAGLVKKLLAFSRKQTFRMTPLDLTDTLSDCSVLLRQVLEESVRMDFQHGRNLPLIKADKTQFENAIMNLATNARDAMRDQGGGTLTISTETVTADAVRKAGAPNPREGDWVAIHVADSGHGMDDETLTKIFEPFFTTKDAGKGTGLGLATVYGIVKQSGGFLFAKSRVGKGTTFTIYLPGHEATEEEAEQIVVEQEKKTAEPKPSDLAGKGRILLVEDEAPVRSIAAKTLGKRGYDVTEAEDGLEALEILKEDPGSFDLIISDVVMPELDGPGLMREGREFMGSARVIFISGYAQEEFSDLLADDLDVSFLPKPFTLPQLAERVKEVLGG